MADDAGPSSPCIDVCRIDEGSGWCEGCFRSLAEIAAWGAMSNADQRALLVELPRRRAERRHPQSAATEKGAR